MANQSAPMLLIGGAELSLTAAGSSISDAAALSGAVNVISTAAASTGVKLPDMAYAGAFVVVVNKGANTVNVYPPSSTGTINAGSGGAAVTIATNKAALFVSSGAGTWLHVAGA